MPADRRLRAKLIRVDPVREAERVGVVLEYRALRARDGLERLEDFADLGPEHCVPSVAGLGKVLRIARAARIAVPEEPASLLGEAEAVARLLERAIDSTLLLDLRPRSRLRFVAWTEESIEVIDDVREVIETPDSYLVLLTRGRFPVRVPRESVVRQVTEAERWYEVLSVERG